jgi:alkanesulfonate monooxygenase SsuD/methylene tetrahydromethanopterin reductase-like flavin-dependent oxidoreductase (luciferase family)
MNLGLIGIGSGVCVDPVVAKRVAQRAEALGYDSLWTGEHVVYPEPREEPSNADPDFPISHPSTSLAFIAGVTERVLLGTGIALIAQRNPIVLAKEMASLDVVSQGRLVLGIGAGYVHQEFAALGVNFKERMSASRSCARCGTTTTPPTTGGSSASPAYKRGPDRSSPVARQS